MLSATPIDDERASEAATTIHRERAIYPATPRARERGVYPGESDGKTVNRYHAASAIVRAGWRPIGNGVALCGHTAGDWPTMILVLGFVPHQIRLVDSNPDVAEQARAVRPEARIITGDVLDLDLSDTSYLNLDFTEGFNKTTLRTISECLARLRGDATISITWCRRNGTTTKGRLDNDRRNVRDRTAEMLRKLSPFVSAKWHRLYWGWYYGVNGSAMSTVVYRRGGIQTASPEEGDYGPWNPRLVRRARDIRTILASGNL